MGKIISIVVLSLLMYAGGPPSKGTPKDKRLAQNKPGGGKKPKIPTLVNPPTTAPKTGGKS